ncbi:MAG: hypothetical protein ACE15B_07775 [Bryobacteraceae bacterium]
MKRAAWTLAPLALLVALYWPGLNTYFYQDDFGWLNVARDMHGWRDLPRALLAPKAHGVFRPLSVEGYFLLLGWLFGPNPLPFRIAAFAAVAGAVLLLGALVRQWTGSHPAALAAQATWIVNAGLAPVMCWTSIFNQALAAFLLLLALWFLVKERWRAQWIAFGLALLSLESAVVYPALALAYAPRLWRRLLPMFGVSAAYTALHFVLAPSGGGVYAIHLETLPATLWRYSLMALGPGRAAAIAGAALLAVAVSASRRRYGLAWFLLTLAPYLPLRDHVSDYYLAAPVLGLAMLAGEAVKHAPRFALAPLLVCLAASLPTARGIAGWHYARSQAIRDVVLGAAEARRLEPRAPILLAGMTSEVFQSGFADLPFRALGIERVYLAPGEERRLEPRELSGKFVLPPAIALRERAVVYDASGPVLRNVTARHAMQWKPEPVRFVNAGDPLFEPCLTGNWLPVRNGYRAMRGAAGIRMAAPESGERLYLGVMADKPALRVRVAGAELTPAFSHPYPGRTDLAFTVSARGEIELALETAGELTFGFAEVR